MIKPKPDMFRVFIFIFLVLLLSCKDDDEQSTSSVLLRARMICGDMKKEMPWLRDLVKEARPDQPQMGSIYAGKYEGTAVFIHQPIYMSCLACVVYDCDGNKLDTSTMDHEKLRLIMDDWRLIYSPY